MAYLEPEFRHDLFISYSHGDFDHEGESPLKNWAQEFVKELRYEIKASQGLARAGERRLVDTLDIFLDESHRPGQGIDPTEPLTDQLREEIGASALLAVLMCPAYLGSTWCADELAWWQQRYGSDLKRADGRIFPIRVMPTDKADWPPSLLDERGEPPVGYFYYDRSNDRLPSSVRPFLYRGEKTPEEGRAFRDAVVDTAGQIAERLRRLAATLQHQREARANAERLRGEAGQILYLYARQDDTLTWERTYRDLDDHGYVVLPGDPEPAPQDDLAWRRIYDNRVEVLTGCDALLMLAGDGHNGLDGDLAAVGHASRHAAKARSSKLLPCAVLDRAGSTARSERTRNAARKLGIAWLDTPADRRWIDDVRAWLRQSVAQAGSPA